MTADRSAAADTLRNELDGIAEQLQEALLLAHKLSGPRVRHREDLSPEQADARMIYHYVHVAMKRLADLHQRADARVAAERERIAEAIRARRDDGTWNAGGQAVLEIAARIARGQP